MPRIIQYEIRMTTKFVVFCDCIIGCHGSITEKEEEMSFGRKLERNSTIWKEKVRKFYNLNFFGNFYEFDNSKTICY